MARSYVDKTIRCACCGCQEFDIVEDEDGDAEASDQSKPEA